jgi:hypothetical protein
MTENLEPDPTDPAEAAARATRKMMQDAGLESVGEVALIPEAVRASIATSYVLALTSLTFWIEQGVPIETVCRRIDNIAHGLPMARSARALDMLNAIKSHLRDNAPDHLKED